MADKGCMAKSQMYCCKNIWFLASCSCMHGFYFFLLCPEFNAPVCNHSGVQELLICCSEVSVLTAKECLYVYRNRNVAVLAFDGQLDGAQNYYVSELCTDILYINTQLQNINLKWASQIPLCYSLYELHSHFFHAFPTLCDVLSVWRHLWKLVFLYYFFFLHPASLYTSRHSWCRYNNQ